jgi:hypothetical protein
LYHLYNEQDSVEELAADKLDACCIVCGNNSGTGGLAKHIKNMHDGQLKFVDPDHGGTLGIDIDSTIEKKGNIW